MAPALDAATTVLVGLTWYLYPEIDGAMRRRSTSAALIATALGPAFADANHERDYAREEKALASGFEVERLLGYAPIGIGVARTIPAAQTNRHRESDLPWSRLELRSPRPSKLLWCGV